jgi:hypothetical protein
MGFDRRRRGDSAPRFDRRAGRAKEFCFAYIYVWAGTGHDSTRGLDMMMVLDGNPSSRTYGKVLSSVPMDSAGLMPHHTEFILPANGRLFANDYEGNKSFLIDFSHPATPGLAGPVSPIPGGRKVHSFARLPNGDVIATYQFGDGKVPGDPGGIAEFDSHGRLLRVGSSRDAAFPGARIRTYGLAIAPKVDRVVTTSSPMDNEKTAHIIQVWRLSDLKLLKTFQLPRLNGDSAERMPFEARLLSDGSVLVNTYTCGFYRVTNLESAPKVTRVLTLPKNLGCSVPIIAGRFEIMPIAYAHRYATIDIADPAHPVETASFPTDTTFYPHWISADPGSDRVVMTDQGDGQEMVMVAHLNRVTGRLAWDEKFRDAGSPTPGVSFRMRNWPNGFTGMAMPHAALFVP